MPDKVALFPVESSHDELELAHVIDMGVKRVSIRVGTASGACHVNCDAFNRLHMGKHRQKTGAIVQPSVDTKQPRLSARLVTHDADAANGQIKVVVCVCFHGGGKNDKKCL